MLSDATSFQLHLTQIIAIGPGAAAQQIHRDQWAFDFFTFPVGYEVQCNTIWAMTDFTEANGATRVVPGSNLLADKLQFKLEDTEPAEMDEGLGAVLHRRRLPRWRRQPERRDPLRRQHHLQPRPGCAKRRTSTSRFRCEIARELPKDLLRLMGYALGAYALGYIDDVRDPIAAVRPDLAREGFGDIDQAAAQAKLRQ